MQAREVLPQEFAVGALRASLEHAGMTLNGVMAGMMMTQPLRRLLGRFRDLPAGKHAYHNQFMV